MLPLALPPGVRLLLADVDAGSDTPSLVGKVLKWRAANNEAGEKPSAERKSKLPCSHVCAQPKRSTTRSPATTTISRCSSRSFPASLLPARRITTRLYVS